MGLPFVRLDSFTAAVDFDALAQGLLKEVISADASMQLYQRLVWREAMGGSEVLEGLDRLHNLGLAQARFTFHLQPVGTSPLARAWKVLTEPLGRGWFSRVARLLVAPPRSFRITSGASATPGGLELSITVGRQQNGEWKVERSPQPQEVSDVARLVG